DWILSQAVSSPDGRYVAILENAARHPRFARLSILDSSSGEVTSRIQSYGMHTIVWPKGSPFLTVWSSSRPAAYFVLMPAIFPTPFYSVQSDDITIFSPKLERLRHLQLKGISNLWPMPDGGLLL